MTAKPICSAGRDASGGRRQLLSRACGKVLGCRAAFQRSRSVSTVMNMRCCSSCGGNFSTSNCKSPLSSFRSLGCASATTKIQRVSS